VSALLGLLLLAAAPVTLPPGLARPAITVPPLAATSPLPPGFARAGFARGHQAPPVAFTDSDLVVGYPDTAEVRVITGRFEHSGNIVVLNHGTLLLDHADVLLRGDIYVYNSGTFRAAGGHLTVDQQFAYQHVAAVTGAGRFEFDSASVDFNGWSWSLLVADSAAFSVRASALRNGFATIAPVHHSSVEYSHSDFSSEFVIFDSCRIAVSNCDTTLVWLHFPDGSTADLTLAEPDTTILHWELNGSTPGVTGIRYSVTLDTVRSVLWGCFPLAGSQVTFRDSRLRTTGLIIPDGDSLAISGLLNNQHHDDYRLPLADRDYRLVNTDLSTWNLYPGGALNLTVTSSVFGELLAADSCRVTIQSSICDGSGGYLGAEKQSTLLFLGCLVTSQVVSRDRALAVGGLSTVLYGPVTATDASTMLLLYCVTERTPVARDTSLLYLCDYAVPDGASVDDSILIAGTADIRPGPQNPVRFASYRLSFASVDSPGVWRPVGAVHPAPVVGDTLDVWDTRGLVPGTYFLRLTLTNSVGDSIEPVKGVFLGVAGIAEDGPARLPAPGLCVAPNPARGPVTVRLNAPTRIGVFDPLGRLVRAIPARPSPFALDLPPGLYFLHPDAPGAAAARVVVVR
jgi:hypothetical protein